MVRIADKKDKIVLLALRPTSRPFRAELRGCYSLLVRKRGARHGHYIFYKFDDAEVDIIRLLTAHKTGVKLYLQ